ncbi:MAG TPA: HEAT repeat domain-containing protein [Tepidisphaeraceae bacterium]
MRIRKRFGMNLAVLALFACAANGVAAEPVPPATEPAFVRPETSAIRVPDGAIHVDNLLDDEWAAAGDALNSCAFVVDAKKSWAYPDPERGKHEGPEDAGVTLHFAHDSKNLYIRADVHDNFLVNNADEKLPNNGDDLELFLDANPADARFGDKNNENVHQIMFVPGGVNPLWEKAFIWQREKNPGVEAASRLRPWGYTMQIKVPKELLPNWKEHPDLDAIGFEGLIGDADAPGVDCHHPALKGALFFGTPARHFLAPAQFMLLKLPKEPIKWGEVRREPKPKADEFIESLKKLDWFVPEMLAQTALDLIDDPRAAEVAAAMIRVNDPAMCKAGAQILAVRPALKAPIDELIELATPTAKERAHSREITGYAMMALAERQKLPAEKFFDLYGKNDDPQLRLTYLWCCGVNRDAAIVPRLLEILRKDPSTRARMMAALALGEIGGQDTLQELQKFAEKEPGSDVRNQALNSIKQIQAAATKPVE